jgi:hypothetical protein
LRVSVGCCSLLISAHEGPEGGSAVKIDKRIKKIMEGHPEWVPVLTKKGHIMWRHPNGASVLMGGTPSCPRAQANFLQDIRRGERLGRR